MLKNMKIGTKLIAVFLLVGLVPLGVIAVVSLSKAKTAIQTQVEQQLAYVSAVKKAQVVDYFQQKTREATVLSRTADAVIAYRALNAYLEDWDIEPDGAYDVSYDDYQEIYDGKCAVFGEYRREYGYEDVYLIHGEYGHIMYSGTRGNDLGQNLSSGPLKSSPLGALYEKIAATKAPFLTDVAKYSAIGDKPAMFVGSPILDANKNVIGVVAFRLALEQVDQILQNRDGLGETGEAYVVGADGFMRSNAMLAGHETVLLARVNSEALASAHEGVTDAFEHENYREARVLSVYAPVTFAGLTWVVAAEIETAEVFSAIGAIRFTVMVISIVLAGLVVLMGWFMSRAISRPINKVVRMTSEMNAEFNQFADVVEAIAENDLTQTIEPSKIRRLHARIHDEIGQLVNAIGETLDAKDRVGHSMSRMIANLNGMVGRIQRSAGELVLSATNISDSATRIAEGSRNQSDRVDQVSVAVEEMTATIVESARNASAATEASQKASLTATSGGEIVHNSVAGMATINDVVQKSARSVTHLAESAQQIGEIVSVINDVADQTNLLALNAAIEAARAGEQGRGFAVVADEVRKLAERTGKATGEIGDMIRTIQNGTADAVKSMQEGTLEVKRGEDLSQQAGQSLTEIVRMTQEVTGMMEMIATASEQQSIAAEEITKNVDGVAEVVKSTAGDAAQSAEAARDLHRLSDDLQQIVSEFKTA